MPNRILRDWTDSFTIDELDANTERFFIRLIMKVDDYGRFFADARLLRANLFPLKTDVRDTDISRWLAACEKAGLIAIYNVAKKEFLQINNFNQTLRQKKEKYPPPSKCEASAKHLHSTCTSNATPEKKGKETESEKEGIPPPLLDSNLFRQPRRPSLEEVKRVFYSNGGNNEMAEKFFRKHEATGWFLNNSPIENFSSLVYSFIDNWRKFNPQDGKKELVL
jgi:hypothetical protein